MNSLYRADLLSRKRQNRLFQFFIRFFSIIPLLLVMLLLLSLVNRAIGSIAVADGRVVGHWDLFTTIFRPSHVASEAGNIGMDVSVKFTSWLSLPFLRSLPSSTGAHSGLAAALAGSSWIILLGFLIAVPVALATALWVTISPGQSRSRRLLIFLLESYRRIPHVLFGICALALFSAFFGLIGDGPGLRSIGSAGIMMALILLPRLTVLMTEELGDTSGEMVLSSYALGATWQTVAFSQLLPSAISMIAARAIRLIASVLGLASPFIVLGAASFVTSTPASVADRFTTLSVQIFQWSLRPEGIYRNLASAAALFLLTMVFLLNVVSHMWQRRILRYREGLR